MAGWHHRLDGREFEQTPGDGEGEGSLVWCCSWGHKVRCDFAASSVPQAQRCSRLQPFAWTLRLSACSPQLPQLPGGLFEAGV